MNNTFKIFRSKKVAVFLLLNMVSQILFPTVSFALTGGPSQPEVQGFTPIGTSDMVNTFSGDFNYNLPLMDVGGYPINLAYNSGISTDAEASYTGLGWNVNVGALNRSMRGLPDDYKGDKVEKTFNRKNSVTIGVNASASWELIGFDAGGALGLGLGMGVKYNNYTGFGVEISAKPSVSVTNSNDNQLTAGIGLSLSGNGVGISPSVSFAKVSKENIGKDESLTTTSSIGIGLPFNSRSGLQAVTISYDKSKHRTKTQQKKDKEGNAVTKDGKAVMEEATLGSTSSSFSGSLASFSSPSYSPTQALHTHNFSASFSFKFGPEVFLNNLSAAAGGSVNINGMFKRQVDNNAYGLMYAQNGAGKDDVLLDFNREKDGSINEEVRNIALAQSTYDVFSASGQGMGGTYRTVRGDVGTFHDPTSNNSSAGFNIGGIDLGAANLVKGGANIAVNGANSKSGGWFEKDGNKIFDDLGFESAGNSINEFQPFSFQQVGEMVIDEDDAFLEEFGGQSAARFGLDNRQASKKVIKRNNSSREFTRNNRKRRFKSNQPMIALTNDQAKVVGINRNLNYKDRQGNEVSRPRSEGHLKGHHIGEVQVTRQDGARYVYGIPAYNTYQKEVTFATDQIGFTEDGLVRYSTDDASKDNNNGDDHYYQSTVMKNGYAHSYLLTAVVSPDYVDITGDGPSPDDLGNYTKFNYTLEQGDYKWRSPFQGANFNEGMKTKKLDNKASYLYGTKEVWYIQSIETRTHKAIFQLTDRADSHGSANEYNNKNESDIGASLKKLKSIKLFTIKQIDATNLENAVPVKTVHFEYDYSLCKGKNNSKLINNSGYDPDQYGGQTDAKGKLTLRSVYFTYGASQRGRFNPYIFNYETSNPEYDPKSYDRWGNYQENLLKDAGVDNDVMDNAEFPYTYQASEDNEQEELTSNQYAAAWSMTSINLPSGGTIQIDYEADDYAFVQNKRAMQMMLITGSGKDKNDDINKDNRLNETSSNGANDVFDYLYFKLPTPVRKTDIVVNHDKYFQNTYLKDHNGRGISELYFRFFMHLSKEGEKEYVSGYAEADIGGSGFNSSQEGISESSNDFYYYGAIKVRRVGLKNSNDNTLSSPISRVAYQYIRLNRRDLAFGQASEENTKKLRAILDEFVAMATQVRQIAVGFNRAMRKDDKGNRFERGRSWIRLYEPEYHKEGGGLRVKRIRIQDNWSTMTDNAETEFSYGQEYSYEKKISDGRVISSGVAEYEPLLGNDENPWRKPDVYTIDQALAPDNDFYQEEPYGETFFPSASVGYSQVTVRNLQYGAVKNHATGKVVYDYYTAYDFPTRYEKTEPKLLVQGTGAKALNTVASILTGSSFENMEVSQGFVIIKNNMHGQQRGQYVFSEIDDETPISGIYNEFQVKNGTPEQVSEGAVSFTINKGRTLDSYVDVVDASGNVSSRQMGVTYDIMVDARRGNSWGSSVGANFNVDGAVFGFIPIFGGSVIPKFSYTQKEFRSISLTKVINVSGIKSRTIAFDLGSQVETKNLLYDQETGQTILTSTVNQFDDPIYSFNYPAHWVYDRLGPAYQNLGHYTELNTTNDSYLSEADELLVVKTDDTKTRGWVRKQGATNDIVDDNGMVISNIKSIYVYRSGRRNMPGGSVGSIVSLTSPLQNDKLILAAADNDIDLIGFQSSILSSSAVEYDDLWKTFCDCQFTQLEDKNEFVRGIKGNWRPKRNWTYLTNRKQEYYNQSVDIREDGTYEDFVNFWVLKNGQWQKRDQVDETRWQYATEVTVFTPRGQELENRDILRRYSAAQYGYDEMFPIAVGANTRYQELGFDGFEATEFTSCADEHFNVQGGAITEKQAHTGRHSIKIGKGQRVTMDKVIEECGNDDVSNE